MRYLRAREPAVSSLQGAALLHAEAVPVPRSWGMVAAIGSTAQLTALVGQASAGSVFEPHAVWWIGAVGGKESRFIPLSLAGWGTSMVAGTMQHRRNVQAAGLRPGRGSQKGRAQLHLLPGPRSVPVIGHF